MILPSEELLSEVLQLQISSIKLIKQNKISFDYSNQFCSTDGEYNIYEIAHKCKSWARSKGFILLTYGEMYYYVDVHLAANKSKYGRLVFEDSAETEPEVIFKACEWILKRKDFNEI